MFIVYKNGERYMTLDRWDITVGKPTIKDLFAIFPYAQGFRIQFKLK